MKVSQLGSVLFISIMMTYNGIELLDCVKNRELNSRQKCACKSCHSALSVHVQSFTKFTWIHVMIMIWCLCQECSNFSSPHRFPIEIPKKKSIVYAIPYCISNKERKHRHFTIICLIFDRPNIVEVITITQKRTDVTNCMLEYCHPALFFCKINICRLLS